MRALNIWKILAQIYSDHVVAYSLASDSIRIDIDGISEKHIGKPFFLRWVPGGYLCAFPGLIKRPLYAAKIFEANPSIIISEGPYMGYALLKTTGIPKSSLFIYDALSVESNYHQQYFNRNILKGALLKKIESIERYVMNKSQYIFSVSEDESVVLQDKYRVNPERIIVVPNGVDTSSIRPLGSDEKKVLRTKLSINNPVALFMGSRVKANFVAAKWISEHLAEKMPEVTFFIIGTVCNELQTTLSNVKLLGGLADSEKIKMLQIADCAINPVQFGAGTNIKMLEYLSAALPIVSTNIGYERSQIRGSERCYNQRSRIFSHVHPRDSSE